MRIKKTALHPVAPRVYHEFQAGTEVPVLEAHVEALQAAGIGELIEGSPKQATGTEDDGAKRSRKTA
jgi:hypothetical protein